MYACAEPDAGAVKWRAMIGNGDAQELNPQNPVRESTGSRYIVKDKNDNVYVLARSIATIDGNVITGSYRAFLIKYNFKGEKQWTELPVSTAAETVENFGDDISIDPTGAVYIAIRYADRDSEVFKFDKDGDQEWVQAVDDFEVLSKSNMAVSAGNTWVYVSFKTSAGSFLKKLKSSDGTVMWSIEVSGSIAQSTPRAIGSAVDGGCYVAGEATQDLSPQAFAGGATDMYIAKFDSDGTYKWGRILGSSSDDIVGSIAVGTYGVWITGHINNGGIATGSLLFDGHSGSGHEDIYTVKFGDDGRKIWSSLIGTSSRDRAQSMDLDDAGNAYIVGMTSGNLDSQVNYGKADSFVIKYDYIGNKMWTRLIGSDQDELFASISAKGDGIAVVGTTSGNPHGMINNGKTDVYMIQYVPECAGLRSGANFTCPPGRFCPEGITSEAEGRCPIGTYSDRAGLHDISQCLPCLPGYYCNLAGMTSPNNTCSGGYYCEEGAADPTASTCDSRATVCDTPACDNTIARTTAPSCGGQCEPGTYCPPGSSQPLNCTKGHYCDAYGLSEPVGPCAAGYYCDEYRSDTSRPADKVCPEGHYCPEGSILPTRCPSGSSSSSTGNENLDSCEKCPAGYYCPDATGGATDGISNQIPCTESYFCPAGSASGTIPENICPTNHYCPAQSATPTPCPPAQFQDLVGQTSCKPCVEGFYCPGGDYFDQQLSLDPGWVPGTVSNRPDGGLVPCFPGSYCPGNAVIFPELCPTATYNPKLSSISIEDCLICPAGQYCNGTGLGAPSGPCGGGHYCPVGMSLEFPPEFACPRGYECPPGSKYPRLCYPGTLAPGIATPYCDLVTAGYYANATGLVSIGAEISYVACNQPSRFANLILTENETNRSFVGDYPTTGDFAICQVETVKIHGICTAGYYCKGGSETPTPLARPGFFRGDICPAGSFCPRGTNDSLLCPAGFWQGYIGMTTCDPVPVGYAVTSPLRSAIAPCPQGFFCLQADPVAPQPCPVGTYGGSPGLRSISECSQCTPGMFCASAGIPAPTGPCSAGYKCGGSTLVSTPTSAADVGPLGDASLSGRCPKGHYCPVASTNAIPCPAGTFNDLIGGMGVTNCLPCTPGRYCASSGIGGTPLPTCSPGFYCPNAGEYVTVPVAKTFIKNGSQCDSVTETVYIAVEVGQTSAKPALYGCPAGFRCPAASPGKIPCCGVNETTGLSSTPLACVEYQPNSFQSTCIQCPAGKVCQKPSWEQDYAATAIDCPVGYYCEFGKLPKLCPDGKYGVGTGLKTVAECSACPSGKWCAGGFLRGDCLAGYYCGGGASCPAPSSPGCPSSATNNLCPEGSFCPLGVASPIRCPEGTQLSSSDLSYPGRQTCDCIPCGPGLMCPTGSINPTICPRGFYCMGPYSSGLSPATSCVENATCGTFAVATPCPAGTYNPVTGSTRSDACIPCGEIIVYNSSSLLGNDTTYRGYYCPDLNSTAQKKCPPGYFCPPATPEPIACPHGMYRMEQGGHELASCETCPATFYCPNASIVPLPCPATFYCPYGAGWPTVCPGGYYCPANTSVPIISPEGTYSNIGSAFPTICPAGTYCGAGLTLPNLCPLGMYSNPNVTMNRTTLEGSCVPCRPGTYGNDDFRLMCGTCWAGYVCYGNTTRGDPRNLTVDRGTICPKGHWCGNGTASPNPCPRGTFNEFQGMTSAAACLPCPRNSFNNFTGQPSCNPCGGSAISSDDNYACSCKGNNRVFHQFDSACRCRAGFAVYDALGPVMSESNVDGVLDCYQISLARCAADEIYTQDGRCVRSCDDSKCVDPPCFCTNQTDYCANACPDFQTPKAERVQIDETVGMALVCSCKCPVGSTDSRCADPNLVPIAITYELSSDSAGTTVLTITSSGTPTTYLVPGLASTTTGTSSSQFIGSSPSGFAGVLDAPLSYYESLGIEECAIDTEGVCNLLTTSAQRRSTASLPQYDGALVMAGPAEYHSRLLLEESRRSDVKEGGIEILSSRRQLSAVDTQSVTGVQTPLICITAGDSVTWTITSSAGVNHYPQYKSDSLFNTNPTFDYGPFMNLAQQVQKGYPVTAFSHKFDVPGVYIFNDAGDATKESAIGVVNPVISCPRSFEKNPIQTLTAQSLKEFPDTKAQEDFNLITPDYQFIFGVVGALAGFFVLSISCVYIRRASGWGQTKGSRPAYRQMASKEDFQAMATKKQRIKKGQQGGSTTLDELDELAAGYVDLEGFNVQMLYDKLQDQTHLVAEQLTQQKHDVREFYDKVTRETVTLRTIVDKNNSAGASAEQMRRADKRRRDIDRELRRRKELGVALRSIHKRQQDITGPELDKRLEYYSSFFEGIGSLREDIEKAFGDEPGEPEVLRLLGRLESMRKEALAQHKARPQITAGTGAQLLDGGDKPVSRNQLVTAAGDLAEIPGLTERNKVTGLIVPCRGTKIRLGSKHIIPTPSGMCFHPATGHVIPVEGNVYIDTETGKFHVHSEMPISGLSSGPLPYIINRMTANDDCYPSQTAAYTSLVPNEAKGLPLNRQRDMIDPFTGLRVPVLGVTSDLRTGELVAVGGTMIDPETRLIKPLRLGDMMEDEETKEILVIQGFAIDPKTAKVVPLGGRNVSGGDSDEMPPMVLGDVFRDEFSGEKKVIGGCILDPITLERIIPVQDDCPKTLDALEIQVEQALFDIEERKVQSLKQRLSADRSKAKDAEFKKILGDLTVQHLMAQDEYNDVYAATSTFVLSPYTRLSENADYASMLAETGGQKGTMTDPISEKELPLLIGCMMYDEHSKYDVPILDAEEDSETGIFDCLGCTVIDPISGSIVPATLGGRMRDPASGETVPITSVYRDKSTFQTVAVSTLHGDKKDLSNGLDFDAKQLLAGLLSQMQGGGGDGGQALAGLLGLKKEGQVSMGDISDISPIKQQRKDSEEFDPKTSGWQRRKSMIDINLEVHVPTLDDGEEAVASEEQSYMDRLNKVLENAMQDGADEEMIDAASNIRAIHSERVKEFVSAVQKAETDIMDMHEAAVNVAYSRDDIDEAEKQRLLDELDRKASVIKQILDQEHNRQEAAFERQMLESAERKMRKLARRQNKQKEIDSLVESGDIPQVEKAVHRMESELDSKLDDGLESLTLDFAKRRLEEITNEQKLLLQAFQADDVIPEDMIEQLVGQYDKDVEKIETRNKNESSRAHSDLESQNDTAKAKRSARLRASQQGEKRDAAGLWKLGKTAGSKNVGKQLQETMHGVIDAAKAGDPDAVKNEVIERQENQKKRLAKALNDQADAERRNLEIEMELKKNRAIEEAKLELSKQLQRDDLSDDERKRLIAEYESNLSFLNESQNADKARQMRDLEARLEARRKKKLDQEQKALHNQELELVNDPSKVKDAGLLAVNADAAVRREVDEARMSLALQEQAEVEVAQVRQHNEDASNLLQSQDVAERDKITSDTHLDEDERARLLREHEIKMAKMSADVAMKRNQADDDLKARLDEKRKKKKALLEGRRAAEEALLSNAKPEDVEDVLGKIEQSRQESALVIRQEEEMAQVASDLLAEAQAEIRMLREELREKEQTVLKGEQARFEDDLNMTDLSGEERERLLKKHDEQCRLLEAQMKAEEAKQIAGLEAKLAAKRAKKQKKIEANHIKELEQVKEKADKENAVGGSQAAAADSVPYDGAEARKKIEAEMKAQEEAELAAMREKMQKEKEALLEEEKRRLSDQLASEMASDMSEDDRAKLIAANEANMARLEQYMDKERQRQEEELKAMLAAKKDKKKAKLQAMEERKVKESEVQQQQQQQLAELEKQQEEERKIEMEKIQAEIEAEKEKEAARIAADLAKVFKKKKQAETEDIKKKIAEASEESEKERLMKEAEEKITAMEKMEAMEQAKQNQVLEEKLAAKRARKAKALQKKQEEALEKKIIEQVDEAENIISTVAPELEEEEDEAEEELVRQQASEQAKAAAAEFAQKLEEERKKFEEEMQNAMAEQEKIKEELKRKQEEERKKLEEEMQRDAQAFEEQMKRDQEAKMQELASKRAAMEAEMSKASEVSSACLLKYKLRIGHHCTFSLMHRSTACGIKQQNPHYFAHLSTR